jgi:hypothetical protein
MSSLRKLESARNNGAKSRGPNTPEGKERSAMNSARHGFAASKIVLAAEDRPQFDAMRDAFIEKHQPADEVESSLVDEMVVANWRLYRIWAGEAAMFDRKMQALLPDPEPSTQHPERGFGQAFEEFAADENALKLMMRYEANCRWQYDRALRNLLSLRKAAADQPQEPGVAKTIKFFYCAHAGDGLCDASNPHEKCPKREPCNADEVPPGASPFAPEPNEPNPTNEHPHYEP